MKKLDEMDKKIRLKAHSASFKVTLLLLSFWTLYESCVAFMEKQAVRSIPGYILLVAVVFESIYEQILKHRMVEGDEEYKEPNKVLLIIITIIVAIAIILSIGSVLIFK